MTTKVCSKCKVEKDLGEFPKDKTKRDGLHNMCKECRHLLHAKWRADNPEKMRGYWAKARANNPEKGRAQWIKWCAENPEKIRGYRAKNPEKVKASRTKWRAENPEKVKACRAKCVLNLEDPYVRGLLKLPNPPQELIELKRLQLQLIREIKQQGK